MFASSYSAASGKKQSDGSPLPSIKSNKLKTIPIVPEIEVDPGSDLGGSSMREENSLANLGDFTQIQSTNLLAKVEEEDKYQQNSSNSNAEDAEMDPEALLSNIKMIK